MKTITLWLLLCLSNSYADMKVEFVNFKEHSEKLWELRVAITNYGDEKVILNTGYLQHGIEFNEQEKAGRFYLLTGNEGTSEGEISYKKVPSIDEMKLVTLKKHQYTLFSYQFKPDEDDRKMLDLIKTGKSFVVVYLSKDRDFSYSYWKGKVTSQNYITVKK